MTRFTPKCLARTDFSRLVRNDPSAARARLEALVADPEALDHYGENLSFKSFAGPRLIDHSGWDNLRRRILREGLGESTLDNETLARLAHDFDALAELQFDLFSSEVPQDPWRSVLAHEHVERACSELCCEEQTNDPLDAREVVAEVAEGLSNVGITTTDTDGKINLGPIATSVACNFSYLNPPTTPVRDVDVVLGGADLCVFSEPRPSLQRHLAESHGWLHWSNHLTDYHTTSSGVTLLVRYDTRTKPDLASFAAALEWTCATFATLASICHQLHSPLPPESWPYPPESARPREASRTQRSSWFRWVQRYVSFLRSRNNPCEELGQDVLAEHFALLCSSFSTLDVHWMRERARPPVVFVDAAIQAAVDDVTGEAKPDAATGFDARTERYADPIRNDGRLARRQLPSPRPSGTPRRELASTI